MEVELQPGWLNRQLDIVKRQSDLWPDWRFNEMGYTPPTPEERIIAIDREIARLQEWKRKLQQEMINRDY